MGGIDALKRVLHDLPDDWPATAFIVQHTSDLGPGLLSEVFARVSKIPVAKATHGLSFRPGQVFVAPPGKHLLVENRCMLLSSGPKENQTRPAIDPLFRSAAVSHGSRVVGVVLTGMLDDGSAGLHAVVRCGGIAVVQHPRDAEFPDMPRNALLHTPADMVLPLAEIPAAMDRLSREPAGPPVEPPPDLLLEMKMTDEQTDDIAAVSRWGDPVPLICPECGGPLWTRKDGALRRYRCHIGHAFTADTLVVTQADSLEANLWTSVRAFEEQAALHRQLEGDLLTAGRLAEAAQHRRVATNADQRARHVRGFLHKVHPTQGDRIPIG